MLTYNKYYHIIYSINNKNLEKNIIPKTESKNQKFLTQYHNKLHQNTNLAITQMNYTALQYRKVEQQFMQQFELRSLEFYDQSVNSQSLIEYKKLLNQIKTRRKDMIDRRDRFSLMKKSKDEIVGENDLRQEKEKVKSHCQDEEYDGDGFYLTENILSMGSKPVITEPKQDAIIPQSFNGLQISNFSLEQVPCQLDSQKNENLNLTLISDRIYTQYNVQQCLRHEQSQVQQGIICFKRRIIELQQQLSAQKMKQKQVERLYVQSNNEMMHVKYTNQELKGAFVKTRKHFNLDLQGRKLVQQRCSSKNKFEFEQSVVNHINMKKMKQILVEQQMQLFELQQKRESLSKKEQKHDAIYGKEQELVTAYEAISEINPKDFAKKGGIVSILDKDFEEFDGQAARRKSNVKTTTLQQLSSTLQHQRHQLDPPQLTTLPQIVTHLIEQYKRMKHQLVEHAKQFKLLTSQKDEQGKHYEKAVSTVREVYESLEKQVVVRKPDYDSVGLDDNDKRIKEMVVRNRMTCERTIAVEERLKFCLKRYLAIVQSVVSGFMKGDKLSAKQIEDMTCKYQQATTNSTTSNRSARQLLLEDSRNLLIGCFQNWQEYIGFADILHESTHIQRFISKQKLFALFKRVIKTKNLNSHIPTQKIFQKAIGQVFEDARMGHVKKVENLIEVYRLLYKYLKKVDNGEIKLHCAINYDSLAANLTLQEPVMNEHVNKHSPRNELERKSTTRTFIAMQKLTPPSGTFMQKPTHHQYENQMLHSNTYSSTQKLIQPTNLSEVSILTKLKKKRQLGSVLDIHEFYEDMKEEIGKVNKMAVY